MNFETQDWGIINASPYRVKEFIKYFNTNKSLPETIKYQLFELIIASLNEAILKNTMTKEQEALFKELIQEHSKNPTFKPILNYWKKITNTEEFPVGKLL